MAIPGTIQFPGLSSTPSPPPVGSYLLYTETDNTLRMEDSSGNVYIFGSTGFIDTLTGDVTTGTVVSGSAVAIVNSVGGQTASAIAYAATQVAAATFLDTPSTLVLRDSSGNFSAGTITAALTGNVTGNVTGNLTGNVTGGTITGTTITGLIHTVGLQRTVVVKTSAYTATINDGIIDVNASGGSVVITLPPASTANEFSILKSDSSANTVVIVPSGGDNITGKTSITLYNQYDTYTVIGDGGTEYYIESAIIAGSGPLTALTGDVSALGPGSATATVNFVGGQTASAIAAATVEVDAATSSDTPSTLVYRDSSGNFSAGIITATLNGNAANITATTNSTLTTLSALSLPGSQVTGNISGNAAGFTGSLSGDVTGTQSATTIASTTITGKLLTGYTVGTNTPITSSNSILTAFQNLQAQISTTAGAAITSLTGDVSATGPGAASATINYVGGQSAAAVAYAATQVAAATSTNTASTLVLRDASGNFSANVVTASLVGNVTGNVTGNVSGTSANVTGIVAIANGGTGQTTAINAFNALSPMTTLGDIIYENSTPSAARLPGNTSSVREFLTSQGSGGLATAPTWSALVSGDIPNNAANTTGTASNITATTNSTLTTLTALSLPGSQVTGNISGNAANVTGVVAIAHGGTGQTTAINAFNALSPMVNPGDIIYENSTPTATNLPIGTTGQILTVSGGLPVWASPATSGTVTSVSVVSTNGFAGTVANPTTTPAITIETTVTGILYGNGTAISAAIPSEFPTLNQNTTGTASNITATSNSTLTTLTALSLPGSQVTGNISGNAANVTGVVAIVNGGTGQTTANAAFNALSPMTTLGDIIYENATPAAARLPGNSTTTREFLTSQGTGSAATAPTWSALVSGDIPNNAANTTGTASNITATTNTTLTSLPDLTSASALTVTGSQVGGFTQGSVIFAGASGTLSQDNANFYWNDTTWNLGLGIIPATNIALDIVNSTGASKAIQTTSYGVGSSIPFRGRFARGTPSSPAAVQSGDNLSVLSGRGYGTSQFATASTGAINIVAGETFTNTSNATYLQFEVTPTGSVTLTEAMRLNSTGDLLIGTTTDSGTQKLQVNGNSNVGTVTGGVWNSTDIGVAYGGTGISTIPTNGQLLIGNGTGYTLGTITAGTGISVTNAAGSITVTNTQATAFTTKTANYTILSTDGTIFCDTSGGAFTLTLPSPTGLGGKLYRIIDSTGFFQTNNLTLAPSSAEKIEGLAASKVLQTPWGGFTVTTDGTNWFVMG